MEASLKVLLIDDDSGDIRMMTRAIKKAGLGAVCAGAADVAAALDACEATSFDCAIVDYLLPGQNGLAALAELGRRYPFMCLIMSTGQGDEAIAAQAMKLGASDYIRKSDISPASIRRVIESGVEKVRLRRKLAEQQQELARFAEVLVHDLRAPSSSIQTFLMYIQEDLEGGNLNMVREYCAWALKAAARMDTLIATLYQYTRIDGEVSFGPVVMNEVIASVLGNLHSIVLARGAVITRADLPIVTGSASLLEQLIQNLLGNAIKYCKREVPTIHIDARLERDGTWLFSIKDNGIGIPAGDHLRIFESFTRLHGVGEYEGTGLGLATCSKIVARHGGGIRCDSVEGEGTTIYFTLPSTPGATASLPADSQSVTSAVAIEGQMRAA